MKYARLYVYMFTILSNNYVCNSITQTEHEKTTLSTLEAGNMKFSKKKIKFIA